MSIGWSLLFSELVSHAVNCAESISKEGPPADTSSHPPHCVESLSMKLGSQVLRANRPVNADEAAEAFGLGVLGDTGLFANIAYLGEDTLGSLGLDADVWRPGMLTHVTMPRQLFSPFWPGWCAKTGYPLAKCCREEPGLVDLACFDALHTRDRCCSGLPKPVVRLYQIMTWPQVWVEGRCHSSPPRKIYGGHDSRGRLVVCERWEGKFPLVQHVWERVSPYHLMVDKVSTTFEKCEESALLVSAMRAVVVAFQADMGCFSIRLIHLPPVLWEPRNWQIVAAAYHAIGALCLPMAMRSAAAPKIEIPAEVGEEAIKTLGNTAKKLADWALGDLDEQPDNARHNSDAVSSQQDMNHRAETILAARTNRCLLTPTHPPHFPHVALLLEAVTRLAQDPPTERPIHIVVFDTHADLQRFRLEQSESCSGNSFVVKGAEKIRGSDGPFASPSINLVLVTLEDLLKLHGESYSTVEAIQQEHAHSGEWSFQPYGPCRTGWGQVHQGVKKLYGLVWARQALGCELTWTMDSDSFPLRPFWFAQIFEAYQEMPWVQTQEYGSMHDCYGTPALIHQECAHLIITHKLRLAPAGAYGYRPSDFWVYDNWRVEEFMQELRWVWGEPSFLSLWMRGPAHGEGLIFPAWLHLRHANGARPISEPPEHPKYGSMQEPMSVLDIPTFVRQKMPNLYAAACLNATVGLETGCADDFSIVPRAVRALGLPETSEDLRTVLKDPTSLATIEFLSLLRLLDSLPVFGVQGHGDVLRFAAAPALLEHWHHAMSWCVSNCDWRRHAARLLAWQGLQDLYDEVFQSVPAYAKEPYINQDDAIVGVAIRSGQHDVTSSNFSDAWAAAGQNFDLRCFQRQTPPYEEGIGETKEAWVTWDTCLDIVHYVE